MNVPFKPVSDPECFSAITDRMPKGDEEPRPVGRRPTMLAVLALTAVLVSFAIEWMMDPA
jgi:hypothetical protein